MTVFDDQLFLGTTPQRTFADVKVTERRAPTDESVRLLREMEEAAAKKLTEGIVVEDNRINAVVNLYDDHLSGRRHARATYSLNGQRFVTDASVEGWKLRSDPMALVSALHGAMAREIAAEVLLPALAVLPIR